MKRCAGAIALFCLTSAAAVPAGVSRGGVFPEATIERALEDGCSLVVAEILSARSDAGRHYYTVRVFRTLVAGDLTQEEANKTQELFAGASSGGVLKVGSHYATFISRDCPFGFSWAFRGEVLDIDPSDRKAVVPLLKAADRVYAKTAILMFRRGRVWTGNALPDLPEELALLCKEFRESPGRRAETGRRIFESDLGSRIDKSRPTSSIRTYLPPKTSCSRGQIIALLGFPTWTSGWVYSWSCSDGSDPGQGRAEIGVLSVTFDPNELATRVLYGMQDRSRWIKPRVTDYLAEADGDPAGIARAFQEALRESDWIRALSCCSQRVKAEAARSDSVESFFRRFVPVEAIGARPGFNPREFSSRDGRATRMSVRVGIPVSGSQWPVDWLWTLVRAGRDWSVDFEAMPLDIFVRKELLRREFMEQRQRMEPEEFSRAIEFRLSPIDGEFVIGKPMRFRVEMKNVSETPVPYSRSGGVMTGDPMLVTDPNGQAVPYVDTSYQISVSRDGVLPGETIVLAEGYDVTPQYRIVRAGRYRFQFRGWPRDSELSNVCEMEVKPGVLSDVERISESLLSVMPSGWRFERMLSLPPGEDEAPGAGGLFFNLIGRRGGKGDAEGVFLEILKSTDPADTDPWLKEYSDLWGLSPWGLVYGRTNEADRLWPGYRAQIERTLEISPMLGWQ